MLPELDVILDDFITKPTGYTTMSALTNRAYSDLFYFSRRNSNDVSWFSSYNNDVNTVGGSFSHNGLGLTVLNAYSQTASSTNVFTATTDAVGLYANTGKLFAMIGYSYSKVNSSISTEFFGTAYSDTTAHTVGAELSFKDRIGKFGYSVGSRYSTTAIDQFAEQGRDVNLTVARQQYSAANLVATLDYLNTFDYRGTEFFYGADLEYTRYFYSSGDDVRVSTGGTFTSVQGVNRLSSEGVIVSINAGTWLSNRTNLLLSVSNATNDPTFTVSLGRRF